MNARKVTKNNANTSNYQLNYDEFIVYDETQIKQEIIIISVDELVLISF